MERKRTLKRFASLFCLNDNQRQKNCIYRRLAASLSRSQTQKHKMDLRSCICNWSEYQNHSQLWYCSSKNVPSLTQSESNSCLYFCSATSSQYHGGYHQRHFSQHLSFRLLLYRLVFVFERSRWNSCMPFVFSPHQHNDTHFIDRFYLNCKDVSRILSASR